MIPKNYSLRGGYAPTVVTVTPDIAWKLGSVVEPWVDITLPERGLWAGQFGANPHTPPLTVTKPVLAAVSPNIFLSAIRHVVAGALAVASVLLAGLSVEAYANSQKDPGIPVPSVFHMTFEPAPPN